MAVTSDLDALLRFYATRQKSPFVLYNDFSEYVKRYAQKNVTELQTLAPYAENAAAQIEKNLAPLIEAKRAVIMETHGAQKVIFVAGYFNVVFAARYDEIQIDAKVPFPTIQDMPPQTPAQVLVQSEYSDIIFELLKCQRDDDKNLYAIVVPMDLPSIIFPGNVPIGILVEASLEKLQNMLSKSEYYDYYLKKIRLSNPSKEVSVKNFFAQFVKSPQEALQSLKNSSDCYYFWGQLCHFIRMDYIDKKDFTQEDINILQAVAISEIVTAFYKKESAKNIQQDLALKAVQAHMNERPYFFTVDGILKFTDAKGVPLQGQYSDEALKEFLQRESTEAMPGELPNLLVFKTESGARYFIYKEKVFPLILQLCNEMHDSIKESLKTKWFAVLKACENLPEMNDEKAFNARLEIEVQEKSPVLYALLNAGFLNGLNTELSQNSKAKSGLNFFSGYELLPYSTLLMLSRATILADVKILLPFWYSVPFFVWIARLFKGASSNKTRKKKSNVQKTESEKPKGDAKKNSIISAATKIENALVPEGSSIERELNNYKNQWNRILKKEAALDLTDNVNALIRDYTRNILKALNGQTFTLDRIQNLADTLCKTPNMQKISDQRALYMYVQLYMISLVKNM